MTKLTRLTKLANNTVLPKHFLVSVNIMCISKNANNIVCPCKICHVNVDNKGSAAQCDTCQP